MKQINNQNETKLVTVTRNDIPHGYQVCQTGHSIADFAADFPQTFKQWKEESNSIISLQIPDEQSLLKLHKKLKNLGCHISLFFEPDINAYTSFCFYAIPDIRRKLSHLPLILKERKEEQI